jgi:gas vesicle protein
MNTKAKIALGILGAAAAGVVIGMLLAPEKGSETRKKVKQTAGGWIDSLSHLFQNGRHEVEEVKQKAKQGKAAAEEKVNRIKESLG